MYISFLACFATRRHRGSFLFFALPCLAACSCHNINLIWRKLIFQLKKLFSFLLLLVPLGSTFRLFSFLLDCKIIQMLQKGVEKKVSLKAHLIFWISNWDSSFFISSRVMIINLLKFRFILAQCMSFSQSSLSPSCFPLCDKDRILIDTEKCKDYGALFATLMLPKKKKTDSRFYNFPQKQDGINDFLTFQVATAEFHWFH